MQQNQNYPSWKEELDQFVVEVDSCITVEGQWIELETRLNKTKSQIKSRRLLFLSIAATATIILGSFIYFGIYSQQTEKVAPQLSIITKPSKIESAVSVPVNNTIVVVNEVSKQDEIVLANKSSKLKKKTIAAAFVLSDSSNNVPELLAISTVKDTLKTSTAIVIEKPAKAKMKVVHINELKTFEREAKKVGFAANVGFVLKQIFQPNN